MPSYLQRPLLACSTHLANKARLCLLTLLIMMGVAWGLWLLRPHSNSDAGAASTRSGAAVTLCKHASIAFEPQLSVQQMGQLLRAEDAYILYGPDEFGEYQLRFGTSIAVDQALARLKTHALVEHVTPNPACE